MQLITKWGKDAWMVYEDKDLGTQEDCYALTKSILIYGAVTVVYTICALTFGFLFVF